MGFDSCEPCSISLESKHWPWLRKQPELADVCSQGRFPPCCAPSCPPARGSALPRPRRGWKLRLPGGGSLPQGGISTDRGTQWDGESNLPVFSAGSQRPPALHRRGRQWAAPLGGCSLVSLGRVVQAGTDLRSLLLRAFAKQENQRQPRIFL